MPIACCIDRRYNKGMSYREYARIGQIAQEQGGLITTAQAADVDVSRLALSRMAAAGVLTRLQRGVYRLTGVPERQHEDVLVMTLALGAHGFAPGEVPAVVAAGQTAAEIHQLGDFLPLEMDLIAAHRTSTTYPGVRLRQSTLAPSDVTFIDAVPVLTVEATIADLVDVGGDLSLAGESLADARHHDRITNPDRLRDLLTRSAVARGYATVDVLLDVLAPVQHATPAA